MTPPRHRPGRSSRDKHDDALGNEPLCAMFADLSRIYEFCYTCLPELVSVVRVNGVK